MADVTIYDYWRSSASYRVRIALNLKGIEFKSTNDKKVMSIQAKI